MTSDGAPYRAWDNEHVWHPFTPMRAHREENVPIIAAGEGFHLIDTDGNRYLDGVSSLWCNVHGHRVPEIDAAIKAQVDRIAHSTQLGLASVPACELAHELVKRAPADLDKVFFSSDGSSAIEVALKIAFQYQRQRSGGSQRRDTFVCLGGAYHGDTLGAVSVGGVDRFHRLFEPLLFPTLRVPAPVAYRTPTGYDAESYLAHCDAELERTIEENHERIAGFVIEPLVQGAAGMLVHTPGYLKRVRELTARHGILLIADEVAVGCGRTGTFLACEREQVTPDLLCLGKGLTGGYLPLAATLATDTVHDAFLGLPEEGRTLCHGHTYHGNQLACAAALASLSLFEKNALLENVHKNAAVLSQRLAEMVDWPHVGEVRQRGLMCGVELVRDKATKTPFDFAEQRGKRFTVAARKRGAFLRPLGDVVVLMPPLAMPTNLVHQLCDIAGEAIRAATADDSPNSRAAVTPRARQVPE